MDGGSVRKEKKNECTRACESARGAFDDHRGWNKREGLPRVVRAASGDVCASLTLTSFDANADAFTGQARPTESHARRPLVCSASRVGAAKQAQHHHAFRQVPFPVSFQNRLFF